MPNRFPLVLNELGQMQELQVGDSLWSGLLAETIDGGLSLGFADRTVLYSDQFSGLVLETSSGGDLFIIKDVLDSVVFRFGADGVMQLPTVATTPTASDGAFWYDGHDLYLGRPNV